MTHTFAQMVRLQGINWRALAVLLIVSSLALGAAGAIATGFACGWDFVFHLYADGRCATIGTPAVIWAGSVASFGIGMKFFWAALGAWAVWRSRRNLQ